MRHAILGAAGQLGRHLRQHLPGEVHAFTRAEVDVTRPATFAVLRELRPDFVLNCAAYNFVDRAESEPEAAFAVNALGVRELALLCRELDCTLVHFSSDYVFGLDRAHRMPYTEADAPGPVNAYGVSKLAGEQFVCALCPRHFLIRTCGLYGPPAPGGKGNLATTLLRRAAAGQPLRVVGDQTCTPTYVADLAAAVAALLATDRYGLYHLTNAGACSWFEFAQTLLTLAGLKPSLTSITSAEYGAAACRPTYSVLATVYPELRLRPWQEALAAFLREQG